MKTILQASAAQQADRLAAGELTSVELTQALLDHIAATDSQVKAFVHLDAEGALAQAAASDQRRAEGAQASALDGVPVAVKDNVVTATMPTTAGSKMLTGWIAPYEATVTARLRQAGMPLLGKTNMDEFAMGSSTEFSTHGPTHNPWDLTRVPGGSSGGSAAAVAALMAPVAIGTDTGGSIRQPGALTATVGVKPTYGSISRFGVIPLANSLDHVGPLARTVLDAALVHRLIGGHDPADSTSLDQPLEDFVAAAREGATGELTGLKVGVIKQLRGAGIQPGVQQRFDEALALLTAAGATVVEVDCPNFEHALAAYYLIMPSEASSNLARFDAMRFGTRVAPPGVTDPSAEQVIRSSRDAGFGAEAKRRIILGTFALSAGYSDAYYGQAQRVRTLVRQDFDRAFDQVDLLVSPTAPTTAFAIGERSHDPLQMYLNDIATIPANLAGVPAMSLPIGLAPEDNLPVGLQLIAPLRADSQLYRVGAGVEAGLQQQWGTPLLAPLAAMAAEEEGDRQ